ncbi:MAG: hypothetical protein H0V67_00725, partial [Geodermatophilaceae bacterium]|nr:hypothetical protein [Geodermatophilaceae bacterium]
AGKHPMPEIMIPLVGAVQELEIVREQTEQVLADVAGEQDVELSVLIGTMIELPRAALTADQQAVADVYAERDSSLAHHQGPVARAADEPDRGRPRHDHGLLADPAGTSGIPPRDATLLDRAGDRLAGSTPESPHRVGPRPGSDSARPRAGEGVSVARST